MVAAGGWSLSVEIVCTPPREAANEQPVRSPPVVLCHTGGSGQFSPLRRCCRKQCLSIQQSCCASCTTRCGLLRPEQSSAAPEYWATLLWRKLMGTTKLHLKIFLAVNTYLYAQCLKGRRGGVTLLVINADRQRSVELNLPTASERYTLTAEKLEDTTVELNGRAMRLTSSGDRPQFGGEPIKAGRVSFAPTSISNLSMANAVNSDCR